MSTAHTQTVVANLSTMKFKDKKLILLKSLYDKRFDGNLHDIIELIPKQEINREESFQLAKALEEEGHIKLLSSKDGAFAQICPRGNEYIEEEEFVETNYQPSDPFSTEEKIEIVKRLDELNSRLKPN